MYVYYRATPTTAADNFPVAKVAELKKLKTVSSERHVLGSELSSLGVSYLMSAAGFTVVSLSKTLYMLLSTGSAQEDSSQHE